MFESGLILEMRGSAIAGGFALSLLVLLLVLVLVLGLELLLELVLGLMLLLIIELVLELRRSDIGDAGSRIKESSITVLA